LKKEDLQGFSNMRDDFSQRVKDILAKRVGSRCSQPKCRAPTSGPKKNPDKAINVGVAAHITAASEGGPRYDNTLIPKERASAENGIWLCQTCATLIDTDPTRYTVKKLRLWKKRAEEKALDDIESGSKPANSKCDILRNVLKLVKEQEIKTKILLKERHGDPYSPEVLPKFMDISKHLPGFSWPLDDPEVKDWYFETVSILETGLGKTNECSKKMKRLRKDLLLMTGINCDPEFNTFDTGKLLLHSIDVLSDCAKQIEKKIETLNKI
jgi:hypothetical protein